MTKCEEIVMAPVIEVVTGANRKHHRIVGVIRDNSQISRTIPAYQLRVYSPIIDDGITRWQTVFIGHYQTLDGAISAYKAMCQ
ncbi:MAG: hypothetical protein [Bacteriophage sp.]|nr:MAG: hypothetical protein [Bacteriophage sp.]